MDTSMWKTIKVDLGGLPFLMNTRSFPHGDLYVSVEQFHEHIRPKLPINRWLFMIVKGNCFASASVESPFVQIGSDWFSFRSALV